MVIFFITDWGTKKHSAEKKQEEREREIGNGSLGKEECFLYFLNTILVIYDYTWLQNTISVL